MDRILYNGINKYFNTLISYGYLNYNVINQVLVLLYIQELLGDYYIEYRTNIDSDIMNQVFNKIAVESTLFNLSDNPDTRVSEQYIYYGNSSSIPTLSTILGSTRITYICSMSFEVLGDLECIWFAVPKGVTPNSVKNTGFLSDEFLNKFSSQEIPVNRQLVLVLYTYLSPRALGNPALVTLN